MFARQEYMEDIMKNPKSLVHLGAALDTKPVTMSLIKMNAARKFRAACIIEEGQLIVQV